MLVSKKKSLFYVIRVTGRSLWSNFYFSRRDIMSWLDDLGIVDIIQLVELKLSK